MRRSRGRFAFTVLVPLVLAACQPPEPPPPPPPAEPVRVENPALGVAIADLPAFFRVAENQGEALELVPADSTIEGRLRIVATQPETGGINLVAAVDEHAAEIAARPGGEHKGRVELVSPFGTTFSSRGRYDGEYGTTEEAVIFVIHPWGDRKLQLVYVYPAGEDSRERLEDQLFAVLGEIEALPPSAPSPRPSPTPSRQPGEGAAHPGLPAAPPL